MADNVVASDPIANLDLYGKGLWGPYYVNRQTAVMVYIDDSQDVAWKHTVDGGLTWVKDSFTGDSVEALACWFDRETPGDTGVLINVCYLESIADVFEFFSINVETGVISQAGETIQGSLTVSTTPNLNRCCITKTRSGDLIAAYSTQSEIGCERTTDSTGGSGWTVIDDVYETATEEDFCLLYPADTDDGNDAAALFGDQSANVLTVKIFDQSDSGGTWKNETSVINSNENGLVQFPFDGSIRHSDGHLLCVSHSKQNDTIDDLQSNDITLTLTPSVAAKTDIFTNQTASALCAVVIDQQTDDWYVAYAKGGTWEATVDIVFHKSPDGGATWESEQAYSETTDDYRGLSGGRTIGQNGGFVQWIFFDDDDTLLLNNLVNDVLLQAGSASVGGVWRFNHGTASFTLFEDGDSGFLGVSGAHQSATEADVQLKVYHQYIFKNLNVEVSTLTTNDVYTFAFVDGGAQSSNLAILLGGTGFEEDLTGSELVAANSLVNYDLDGSAGMHGDDAAVRQAQVSYENASLLAPIFAGIDGGTELVTFYLLPGSNGSTTEAEHQHKIKRSTVYKNLRVVAVDVLTGTWDVSVTKDGSVGNLSVQFTTIGAVEDVTGSDAFSDGDLFGIEFVETVAGGLTPTVLQVEANTFEDWKVASTEEPFGTRTYRGFNYFGDVISATEPDKLKSRIGTVLAGNLQTYITTAGSGDRDITLRIGGSNSTNVTIDITGTGFFEDITGVEIVLDDDGAILTHRTSSGFPTYAWAAVEIPHTVIVVDIGEDHPMIMGSLPEFGIGRRLIILVY